MSVSVGLWRFLVQGFLLSAEQANDSQGVARWRPGSRCVSKPEGLAIVPDPTDKTVPTVEACWLADGRQRRTAGAGKVCAWADSHVPLAGRCRADACRRSGCSAI